MEIILFYLDVIGDGRGYKEDKYEFILINSKRKLRTNEPYILASQTQCALC